MRGRQSIYYYMNFSTCNIGGGDGEKEVCMYIIASLIIPSVTSLNLNNLFFLKARDFQVNLMSLYANAVVLATYSHFTLIETT